MKHIGILATTAEGAALAYRHLCAQAAQRLGAHRHPEITLHAFPLCEYVQSWEPDARAVAHMHALILQELVAGIVTPQARAFFHTLVAQQYA